MVNESVNIAIVKGLDSIVREPIFSFIDTGRLKQAEIIPVSINDMYSYRSNPRNLTYHILYFPPELANVIVVPERAKIIIGYPETAQEGEGILMQNFLYAGYLLARYPQAIRNDTEIVTNIALLATNMHMQLMGSKEGIIGRSRQTEGRIAEATEFLNSHKKHHANVI